ncbi:hypothetical protein [Haloferax larsenii]|uniref:Uncharacterized protein n=1 Tax=Haloferax larsenii TaxID=302484 RepID=A0A1H7N779_HALLR|nr:hypothetical protein [Haloferax larsenii]SEL19139.1 hypothetical protein SAMN04488691_103207 [Haloferax larsenii]
MRYDSDDWTSEKVALAETAIVAARLGGDWVTFGTEGVDEDDLYDGVRLKNVTNVEVIEDGEFLVEGRFKTVRAVGRIPAGPNLGYGPINPPETITEDTEAFFHIHTVIPDDLLATVEVEVM